MLLVSFTLLFVLIYSFSSMWLTYSSCFSVGLKMDVAFLAKATARQEEKKKALAETAPLPPSSRPLGNLVICEPRITPAPSTNQVLVQST